jgi:hypothetical protein
MLMSKLKQLEVKRLIKEFDFLTSDLDYKNELVYEADNNFIKNVNEFLDNNPEVKKLFDRKINERLDKIIMEKVENAKEEESEEENELKEGSEEITTNKKDDKIKKIYREIVKKTHPDKVDNKRLNDIYIRANLHYDSNDIIQIYSICDELGIDYDINDNDDELIIVKIDNIKQKIKFIESTTTWKWFNTEDEGLKNEIILNYIRSQIK